MADITTGQDVDQGGAAAGTAGWPTTLGNVARSSVTWTSATSIDTTTSLTVTNYGVCTVTVNTSASLSAGALIFEGSDDGGTTWFPVVAARMNIPLVDVSYTMIASRKQMWSILCAGLTTVRVRLNPAITGSGNTVVAMLASAGAGPRPAIMPAVISKEWTFTTSQSSTKLVDIAAGFTGGVVRITVTNAAGSTVSISARAGFAASSLSATSSTPVTGIFISHPGIAPASGIVEGSGSAILAFGADGDDIYFSCDAPTTGSCRVVMTYFIVET